MVTVEEACSIVLKDLGYPYVANVSENDDCYVVGVLCENGDMPDLGGSSAVDKKQGKFIGLAFMICGAEKYVHLYLAKFRRNSGVRIMNMICDRIKGRVILW